MALMDMRDFLSTSNCEQRLAADVARAGFYPEVVLRVVGLALADEPVVEYFIQPETSFGEFVHRHLTALVLTEGRLIIVHVDEGAGPEGTPTAIAGSEAVPLSRLKVVAIHHAFDVSANAFGLPGGVSAPEEMTLQISWGAHTRIDLERADCGDPTCEADHGLTGGIMAEDIVVRVASAVDGEEALEQATRFASALSAAHARSSRTELA